ISGNQGDSLLSIVRGTELYSIEQFYGHLAREDLVSERLRCDPEGRYADAAARLDLKTIFDSGDPPQLDLLSDKLDKAADGTVRASVRIVDAGGGIGSKVIWKVNGLSQGSSVAPDPDDQRFAIMTNTIQVDPSKTADVEVVAYNREGLRASDPLHFKIDAYGASSFGAPRLFVLAVGVGNYAMASYRLNYPDDDAKQLTEKLTLSGRLLFGVNQVVTKVLTATDVNEKTIAATFGTLSHAIKPTDVFVLFLSGHGENRLGRYYYIPQDFDISKGDTWDKTWIGQDKWEKWLAGITAEKQLLILDTCEGEAALGLIKGLPERQTAMDQLRYATGRNIIAAA